MSFDSEDLMIIKFLIVGVALTLVGFYAFYRLLLRDHQENPTTESKTTSSSKE
jgi:hypothetical protein